jgi:hypothetical protein
VKVTGLLHASGAPSSKRQSKRTPRQRCEKVKRASVAAVGSRGRAPITGGGMLSAQLLASSLSRTRLAVSTHAITR